MSSIHDVICFHGLLHIDYDIARRNESISALLYDDVLITL